MVVRVDLGPSAFGKGSPATVSTESARKQLSAVADTDDGNSVRQIFSNEFRLRRNHFRLPGVVR